MMIKEKVTATELRRNFYRYIEMVSAGKEMVITRYGKEIGFIVPNLIKSEYKTDSLIGILNGINGENDREKCLRRKYELD